MKHKSVFMRLIVALIIIVSTFVSPKGAAAQTPDAHVFVNPALSTAKTCQPHSIAISVEDVVDLTAFELKIYFDPTVVEITGVENADWLVAPGESAFFSPDNNDDSWNDDGYIIFGMAQQGDGTGDPAPKSGDGDLILITMQALVPNESVTFEIDDEYSLLADWPDAFEIAFTSADGSVSTENCVPIADSQTVNTYINTPLAITLTGSDGDNDPLQYLIQTNPTKGTLSGDPPNLIYTPYTDFVGTDSFTFLVSDGLDNSVPATITIHVKDVPVAQPDYYDLPVDGSLTVDAVDGVLANDMGPAGETLVAVLVDDVPAGEGTLDFNDDGSFTFIPASGFEGETGFTYRACYDSICSDPVRVTLEVKQVPVAVADEYEMEKDAILNVAAPGVLGNDTAGPGTTLTAELDSDVADGVLTLNSDGSFIYTPPADFTGAATFEYRACDGSVCSAAISSTIEVKVKPVAVDDSYQTPRNVTLIEDDENGVLANDSGADGATLTAMLVTDATVGTLTLNPDGSFEYIPQTNMLGTVTFTYQACDGAVCSDPATVTIQVRDVPVAVADNYAIPEGNVLSVSVDDGVLANDPKPIGVTALTAVLVGTAPDGLVLNADGSFTYTPADGFTGTMTFNYRACYNGICSDPVLVTIEVKALPTAVDDEYQVARNATLSVLMPGVLANDSAPGGQTLRAVLEVDVDEGILVLQESGALIYITPNNFSGTKTFTYVACYDDVICSEPATVTILVKETPVAVADDYEMPENGTLTVPAPGVLGNDTGNDLSAELVGTVPDGLTFNSDGSFTYTPPADFVGTTTFSYRACDGLICSTPVTVSIEVKVKPTAVNDAYQTAKNVTLNVAVPGVLVNDTGALGATLTATLVTDVTTGTLTLNSDGSLVYAPQMDALGSVTFTYKACDGLVCSDPATVTITVKDMAVASDDDYWTFVDQTLTVPDPGVLGNDFAPDSQTLEAILEDDIPVSVGALALDSDGSFVFTPASGWVGVTTFTYRACYNGICSMPATVTIRVLEASCLVVTPKYLEQSLIPNDTADQILTITNNCDYQVEFDLHETWSPLESPLLDEGFEGGTMPPSGGWETVSNGATTYEWDIHDAQVNAAERVDEGRYSAWIRYDNNQASDEWLITSVMDTSSAANLTLSFRAYSSTAYPGATMKLWVTDTDGNPLTDEPLWDLIRDETWLSPMYRSVFVDLSAFDDYGEIRLAWQYIGQAGQSFGLDVVQVGGRMDVPWLSLDPVAGTLPEKGSTEVTVTFDSSGLLEGDYFAALFVQSEPYPTIQVPVILHVLGEGLEYYFPLFRK